MSKAIEDSQILKINSLFSRIAAKHIYSPIDAELYEISQIVSDPEFDIDRVIYKTGNTLLHAAVSTKSLELVKVIIRAGSAFNIMNNSKDTPISYAKKILVDDHPINKFFEDYLLSLSEDLFQSIEEQNLLRIDEIMIIGVDPCCISRNPKFSNYNAITFACKIGSYEAISILSASGKIDKIDGFGLAPIHYAILEGRIDILKLLLERNVNLFIKDGKDRSLQEFLEDPHIMQEFFSPLISQESYQDLIKQRKALGKIINSEIEKLKLESTETAALDTPVSFYSPIHESARGSASASASASASPDSRIRSQSEDYLPISVRKLVDMRSSLLEDLKLEPDHEDPTLAGESKYLDQP